MHSSYNAAASVALEKIDLNERIILKFIFTVRSGYMDWQYLVQVINYWLTLENMMMNIRFYEYRGI